MRERPGLYFQPRGASQWHHSSRNFTTMTTMNISTMMGALGAQFPMLVVCFLGLILALAQLQRLPRVAALVSVGLGLLLLLAVVQPMLQPLIQNLAVQSFNRGRNPMNYFLLSSAIAFAFNIFRAIAIALIAYAAFVDRPLQAFLNPSLTGPVVRGWPTTGGPHEGTKVPGTNP